MQDWNVMPPAINHLLFNGPKIMLNLISLDPSMLLFSFDIFFCNKKNIIHSAMKSSIRILMMEFGPNCSFRLARPMMLPFISVLLKMNMVKMNELFD